MHDPNCQGRTRGAGSNREYYARRDGLSSAHFFYALRTTAGTSGERDGPSSAEQGVRSVFIAVSAIRGEP